MMHDDPFHRRTRQREVILAELRTVTSHPTAVALWDLVRKQLPGISLATVYRNLELLTAAGQVRRLDGGDGQARYDGNVERHDHIRCVSCGRIDDLSLPLLEVNTERAEDFEGYRVIGYRLEFSGLCSTCQKVAADPSPATQRAPAGEASSPTTP